MSTIAVPTWPVDGEGPLPLRHLVQTTHGLPKPLPWSRNGTLDVRYLEGGRLSEPPPVSMSVIVPSWNNEDTLPLCVAALLRAATVVAPTCPVEVIVVDDGSSRAAQAVLDEARLPGCSVADVRVATIRHSGQSLACNTGALLARGGALVFCDADVIVNPWSLASFRRALGLWPRSLCFGFREDVSLDDRRLDCAALAEGVGLTETTYFGNDNRFQFDTPGVPAHLFAASRNLADLTGFRRIRPPGTSAWWLARMAYGCLVAMSRNRFLALGGYDSRFVDWGFNDTELATRWIACGGQLVPVFTANGLHVQHPPRHPMQWRRAGRSRIRYEQMLAEGAHRDEVVGGDVVQIRGVRRSSPAQLRLPESEGSLGEATTMKAAVAGDPNLFEEAAGCSLWESLRTPRLANLALRVLRLSGADDYLHATKVLQRQVTPAIALEAAFLALTVGDRHRAKTYLEAVTGSSWISTGTARCLLHRDAASHLRFARFHLRDGLPRAAASGLLASQLGTDAGRHQDEIAEALGSVDQSDRRVF